MRSARSIFWQSLVLTLVLLAPIIFVVATMVTRRSEARQAGVPQSGIAEPAGARTVRTGLLAIQKDEPEFLLVRLDAPARTITLCGVPGNTVVSAPAGETSLAECYLAAGPARAAQLLGETLGWMPDFYFAATPATWAGILGTEVEVRLDTAAVLTAEQRQVLGYDKDTVEQRTAAEAEALIEALREGAKLKPAAAARLRAALWAAFLRQNPDTLPLLAEGARAFSNRTLTDLTAQELYEVEAALGYLAGQTARTVEYDFLPGTQRFTGEYTLGRDALLTAERLLAG